MKCNLKHFGKNLQSSQIPTVLFLKESGTQTYARFTRDKKYLGTSGIVTRHNTYESLIWCIHMGLQTHTSLKKLQTTRCPQVILVHLKFMRDSKHRSHQWKSHIARLPRVILVPFEWSSRQDSCLTHKALLYSYFTAFPEGAPAAHIMSLVCLPPCWTNNVITVLSNCVSCVKHESYLNASLEFIWVWLQVVQSV